MSRLLGTKAALTALVLAGSALVATSPASADPEPDRWILAGDQATDSIIALDPAVTDWDDPAAVKWTWTPTTALGFSAAEIAAFGGGVTDFELRNTPDGRRMALTAGSGLAAVIAYPSGQRIWAEVVPASHNLHGVELLPNGNVAITSTNTTSGYVRVYAASQGPNASTYTQYSLNAQSHGALWDPITERLWLIGKEGSDPTDPRIITALAITGSDAEPHLTEDDRKWHELPDIGSHDLSADPSDPDVILISTDAHTYEFDKTVSGNPFTELPSPLGDIAKVKAISRQPSGQTIITRPDEYKSPQGPCAAVNYWCTDTVEFFGPDTTRTRTGAQFYRARVMSPDYTAVGDTLHGPVSDRVRSAAGTWSADAVIDSADGTAAIAAAALPDGSLHVFTLVPGDGVWHRSRSSAGTWSASVRIDANGDITALSAAGLPDGTLHVQTVVPGSGVWDRTRSAAGSWSSASKIDSNGAISDVSATALSGVLYVQTLVPGSGVWNRTRSTGGTWASSATKIADGCQSASTADPCVAAISSAALADGTVHVQTLVPGSGVFDLHRSTSGTWSSPVQIDSNDAITRISAAALPNGELHVQTVVPGYGLWDRTRSSGGSWSSASKLDGDERIFAAFGSGLPDGSLHVGHAEYAG